jgi:hypothetical protein
MQVYLAICFFSLAASVIAGLLRADFKRVNYVDGWPLLWIIISMLVMIESFLAMIIFNFSNLTI